MANILVIEDHEILGQLYKSVLRQFNHNAIVVTTGEAGIEAALRERPDLVILDLILPGMPGVQVAQKLRESGILPGVPLVITTALAELDATAVTESIHPTAILNKPFNISSILETLSSVLPGFREGGDTHHAA
jgi:DNA-binding response OmpR family regulator